MSSVVKAELLYGTLRSTRMSENLALLDRFFAPFPSLPFDDACADRTARIRTDLARAGNPIGPYDLMIAGTALAHDLTLVTHNVGEFARVPGLAIEDWEA